MASPTSRTLQTLRDRGYVAAVTERFFAGRRHDLFGGIDILAIKGNETLGVQTTSGNGVQERIRKLQGLPEMKLWLLGRDRRLEVWGWRRRKLFRGSKAVRWSPIIWVLTLDGGGEIVAELVVEK